MKILPFKRCKDAFEANVLKAKLESEGIESFLTNENLAMLKPGYLEAMDMGIDLMVSEDDYEKALSIIDSYQNM